MSSHSSLRKEKSAIDKKVNPAIRDEKFNFTLYAGDISREIEEAIKPIFDKCMKDGMSHADFMYVAFTQINEMILLDLLDRK